MYWHSGKIFSNFLEFSRRGGGARSGGVVADICSIWLFGGKIISNFSDSLGVHFLYWRYAGEILPQIFQSCARTFFFRLIFSTYRIKSKFSLRLEA